MERVPRAVYTKEFKEEAVKMVTEAGLSVPKVARRIAVSTSTIRYWVKISKEGRLPGNRWSLPVSRGKMQI